VENEETEERGRVIIGKWRLGNWKIVKEIGKNENGNSTFKFRFSITIF